MSMNSDWKSFLCFVLASALVVSLLFPCSMTIILVEPIDASVYAGIEINSFGWDGERAIYKELAAKFTRPCTEAFDEAGLRSPLRLATESGIVIHHFGDLYTHEAEDLGLVSHKTRSIYRAEFSTGRAQAGTVPAVRSGIRLTTDGRPRIFIHDSAFFGESFWFSRLSLSDVLTHELIHAGGQPSTPGWLGFFQHDLAGFEHYDKIMNACR